MVSNMVVVVILLYWLGLCYVSIVWVVKVICWVLVNVGIRIFGGYWCSVFEFICSNWNGKVVGLLIGFGLCWCVGI